MARRLIVIVAVLAFVAEGAPAICPHPTPRVCSAYFEHDSVFVGTILSQTYVEDGAFLRFKVRVSRSLRGAAAGTAVVYSPNDSGRVMWTVGKEYLVFARRQAGRLLVGDDCGPLSEAGNVADVVREIEALAKEPAAAIEGEVVSRAPDGPGVAGVAVRAQGQGGAFEATSDSHGGFRMIVPPGRYRILLERNLRASDYSWLDLNDIRLVRGQCAQLQLVTR